MMKIMGILESFTNILTGIPGETNATTHVITLSDRTPIKARQYSLPFNYEEAIKTELLQMLNAGIIEYSDSPYSAPLLPIKKKDNTLRFCVEYQKLNQIMLIRQELMPNPEDLFPKLAKATIFTKIDLSKGYWQIGRWIPLSYIQYSLSGMGGFTILTL